ncbi:hypothetical protein BH10ACT1_BH10ACT1_36190 [soil metagenome]
MTVRIDLDCPSCDDRLRFAPTGPNGDGLPLTTRCGGCGSSFRLWGGRIIPTASSGGAHPELRHRPEVG